MANLDLITLVMPVRHYHKVGAKDGIKSLFSEDNYKKYNYQLQVLNDVYQDYP